MPFCYFIASKNHYQPLKDTDVHVHGYATISKAATSILPDIDGKKLASTSKQTAAGVEVAADTTSF